MKVIDQLKNREEILWINPEKEAIPERAVINGYGFPYMKAAQNRFMRFLPYIASAFPETSKRKGNIESDLIEIPKMKDWLNEKGADIKGKVFLKDDANLPIAGSVKARGGINEVLKIAETLAQKAGILSPTEKYDKLDSEEFRNFFSQFTIQVGSTGNLGLSIGRAARRMGFRVIVHMSKEAKQWKKDLLRQEGAQIIEYEGDYSEAVEEGRKLSDLDENSFFIDDENSKDLFFGYSSAGLRLKIQLFKAGVEVNSTHPLFVYIPCGVGGAPAGITFGLKQMFGDNVHCFFAEPVEAPCFTLGMSSKKYENIAINEIGLRGATIADGLAVGRPSAFACQMMKTLVSGTFTVRDEKLSLYQKELYDLEGLFLEPSACAGFKGVSDITRSRSEWESYLKKYELQDRMDQATHVIWGTGGGLMPENIRFTE